MALIDIISSRAAAPLRRSTISLTDYLALRRSRRALARLDARGLQDIGIDSQAAEFEARRSFWDVPDTWKNQ